jgi:Ca2+-binding EF-hand superfamily protein
MGLEMTTGEFKKFWKGFDTSGDGRISYTEVSSGVWSRECGPARRPHPPSPPPPPQFNNKVGHMVHPTIGYMLKRPDTPKIKEWQRRAIARGLKKKMNNLDDAFREVDADDSGYVSHSEFIQLLRKLGLVKVGNEESYQMMMRAMKPDNKTGQLSFDEFKACMQEYMNSECGRGPCPAPRPR